MQCRLNTIPLLLRLIHNCFPAPLPATQRSKTTLKCDFPKLIPNHLRVTLTARQCHPRRDSVTQDATVSSRTRQCHLGRERVTKDAAMSQRTRLCHRRRDSVTKDATVSHRTRQCHLGRNRVTKDAAMLQRTRLCHTRRDSVTEDAKVSHRARQCHPGRDRSPGTSLLIDAAHSTLPARLCVVSVLSFVATVLLLFRRHVLLCRRSARLGCSVLLVTRLRSVTWASDSGCRIWSLDKTESN